MGTKFPYRILYVLTLALFTVLTVPLRVFSQDRQQISVSGLVSDENNDPLPGVNIVIKGTQTGTVTDVNGFFNLQAEPDDILIFSFVGFEAQEVQVNSRNVINLKMVPEVTEIPEIVVVGYGQQEVQKVTGSAVSLKKKDFNQGVISTPDQLFQGKVPGVDVTKLSGEPGSESFIRIRGANTIRASNRPLIVVDGYPMDIGNIEAGGGFWAFENSPLNFINPNDIESIDFLKDASAAAIYGSRASNGIVLITTKSGSHKKSSLEFSTFASLSQVRRKIPVLSADEFRAGQEEYGFGWIIYDSINTDWQDQVFREAWTQNYDLAFSGGTPQTNYRFSLGYLDQNGIIETSSMRRYTARTNIRHVGIEDRLSVDFNFTFGRTENNQTYGSAAYMALETNPTIPVYDENGDYFGLDRDFFTPVSALAYNSNEVETNKVLGNMLTSFRLLDGLSFKVNLGAERSGSTRFNNNNNFNPQWTSGHIGEHNANSYLIETYLDYFFQVGNSHFFELLAGYSWQEFATNSFGFGANVFQHDLIKFTDALQAGQIPIPPGSGREQSKLQSFYSRLNYSFRSKYLLTVNYRLDGSSRFGDNNKYGHFPSFSLGWQLKEETFLKESSSIDNLKLRASWGINGNQEIPNKISGYTVASDIYNRAIIDGSSTPVSAIYRSRTPNPDLKWEETRQLNIGVEFGLFQSRLSGSLDYYNKRTTDLLYMTEASNAPWPVMWSNLDGEIFNEGIEVGLNGDLVRTNSFRWNGSIVFTTIKNHIQGLPSDERVGGIQILRNGEEIGSFFGPVFLGFDSAGISTYKTDENGERLEEVIGQALPDFTWGFTNTFNYKNFDLSVFVNGVQGNQVYDEKFNGGLRKSWFKVLGHNITPEQLQSEESFDNLSIYSSRFIKNGSFIRLNYITLGYTFKTAEISWLELLRLYFTATNLHVWTTYEGFDPEVNAVFTDINGIPTLGVDFANYPRPATYQLGLNVTF